MLDGVSDAVMEPVTAYVLDIAGFEEFYRREYPGLYAVGAALTGVHNSDDLVQDTMVKALVAWPKLCRLERPGGWCHRVLVNACRGWWRRQRSEMRYVSRLRVRPDSNDGPSAEVVTFWNAVRDLPSRPRKVVALYYAADRSTTEIASILDVPEGTVRSDLARARVVLAKELRS
jgi:RNA polymerase sigma-70 factor (ECF subfamily)